MTDAAAASAVLVGSTALVGLCVGSFACVVIDRLPVRVDESDDQSDDQSDDELPEHRDEWDTRPWREVLGGRSRCSTCGRDVRPIDNIPVVSWLVLRGRCRSCGTHYGGFHVAVELAIPLVAALIAWRLGPGWRLMPALLLVPVGIILAVIDLRTMILPTKLIWPSFATSVVLTTVAALIEREPQMLVTAVVGSAVLTGPLFAIWWFVPRGMGFGDVRLAGLLGWTIGAVAWPHGAWAAAFLAIVAMTAAALVGAIVGAALMGLRAVVPFGPSLVAGALVVIALADTIGRQFG